MKMMMGMMTTTMMMSGLSGNYGITATYVRSKEQDNGDAADTTSRTEENYKDIKRKRPMTQGRWKEAEELFLRVMETRERMLGEEHADTLTNMANLASTYKDQGRWNKAEELQAKELKICARVLGEEHPNTLTSMGNLASTYWDQERWKEAEELEVQVMDTERGQHHSYDPTTSIPPRQTDGYA
jgi:hypothetical protein